MSAKAARTSGKKHNQYVTNTKFDRYAGGFTRAASGQMLEGRFVAIKPEIKLKERLDRMQSWGAKMLYLKGIHEQIAPELIARRNALDDVAPGVRHPNQE